MSSAYIGRMEGIKTATSSNWKTKCETCFDKASISCYQDATFGNGSSSFICNNSKFLPDICHFVVVCNQTDNKVTNIQYCERNYKL
jgi:hypothetical protein